MINIFSWRACEAHLSLEPLSIFKDEAKTSTDVEATELKLLRACAVVQSAFFFLSISAWRLTFGSFGIVSARCFPRWSPTCAGWGDFCACLRGPGAPCSCSFSSSAIGSGRRQVSGPVGPAGRLHPHHRHDDGGGGEVRPSLVDLECPVET